MIKNNKTEQDHPEMFVIEVHLQEVFILVLMLDHLLIVEIRLKML